MNWLYLAIAILSEVIGTTALKSSDGFTKTIPSILVAIGYGCSFYFLSLTLRSIPVGIAYAVWSGVGVVLISILGWWMFGQQLDKAAVLGIALILAGVLVLNLLSDSAKNHG